MARKRLVLTLDEAVLRAVEARAARIGRGKSQVIEESLRRDLGLGEFERIWARVKPAPYEAGLELAVARQEHAMREERRAASGP